MTEVEDRDQSLAGRLSPIIQPIFRQYARSLVQAIGPALQDFRDQSARALAERVEGASSYPGEESPDQPAHGRAPAGPTTDAGRDLAIPIDQQVAPADVARVAGPQPASTADLLERVLDKGIVIAGDITLSVLAIELLTVRIRLLIASVDKAQQIGIDWWKSDPALSSGARTFKRERDRLKERAGRLEARPGLESGTSERVRS